MTEPRNLCNDTRVRKEDVIEHYGSAAEAARELEISRQAVHKWPELVPMRTAYRIQVLTKNKLKVDPKDYA